MIGTLVAAGILVLKEKGLLDAVAITRVIQPGKVRRYIFRAETTQGLDKPTVEFKVEIRTFMVKDQAYFRIETSNLLSTAGEQRLAKRGRQSLHETTAEVSGWIGQPSFGDGLGSVGFALAGLYLPKIGAFALQENPAVAMVDGSQLSKFSLRKSPDWPICQFRIPAKRGQDTGFLWLRTKFRTDGWPEWCDGNWQMGEQLYVFRLEQR